MNEEMRFLKAFEKYLNLFRTNLNTINWADFQDTQNCITEMREGLQTIAPEKRMVLFDKCLDRLDSVKNSSRASYHDAILKLLPLFSMGDATEVSERVRHRAVILQKIGYQNMDDPTWDEAARAFRNARVLLKINGLPEKSTLLRLKVSEFVATTQIKDFPEKYTGGMWFKFAGALETFFEIEHITKNDVGFLGDLLCAMRKRYPKSTTEYETYDRAYRILTENDFDPGQAISSSFHLQRQYSSQLIRFQANWLLILEKIFNANLLCNERMKERMGSIDHDQIEQYWDKLTQKADDYEELASEVDDEQNDIQKEAREMDAMFFGKKRGLYLLFERDETGKVKKAKFEEKPVDEMQKRFN